jgi:hypothetical protein
MPFVKFPTNEDELGNDAVEGGVILPLAIELPLDFSLGVMTEFDFNEDADGRGYHTDFVNTITLSRDLFVSLGGYVEFATLVSTDADSDWLGTIDVGLAYAVTENIPARCGCQPRRDPRCRRCESLRRPFDSLLIGAGRGLARGASSSVVVDRPAAMRQERWLVEARKNEPGRRHVAVHRHHTSLWLAIAADTGATLIVTANALRLLRVEPLA